MPSAPWQQRYLDRYYRHRPGWVDGTTAFHQTVADALPAGAEVLELGPGPSNATSRFLRSVARSVDGLDVDPDAAANDALRAFYRLDGPNWPVPDSGYEAVVANYVFEHVPDPRQMAGEAFRALRPGGVLVFRTPNLYHYVSLVSWLTPHGFHRLVANRLRRMAADAHDPYPTYYRLNTRSALRRTLPAAGFREERLESVEKEPSYGLASRPLFLAFMGYERAVNSTSALAGLRSSLVGLFRKPTTA